MMKSQKLAGAASLGLMAALIAAISLTGAWAQSQINPVDKWSWGENSGWTDWYDDGVSSGCEVSADGQVLSGFIWNENYGWLYLGDGSPDFGPTYGNATAADTGVNVVGDSLGNLMGYAWGEQIGWVNFGVFGGPGWTPANRARIIRGCPSWVFSGYAWSENLGWINLGTTPFSSLTTDPALPMLRGDANFDGTRNGLDILRFTQVLLTGPADFNELVAADMNANGATEAGDIPGFVDCILNGNCLCP